MCVAHRAVESAWAAVLARAPEQAQKALEQSQAMGRVLAYPLGRPTRVGVLLVVPVWVCPERHREWDEASRRCRVCSWEMFLAAARES